MRPRARYHHGDLRHALLRSAQRIIKKRGLAFVSLREVARDARVSHSAPAHHFGNKAGLLTAFATHGFELMAVAGTAEMKRVGGTGPDMLEALGRAYFRFALENPELFGVMFRSELLEVESPEFSAAADARSSFSRTSSCGVSAKVTSRGPISRRRRQRLGPSRTGLRTSGSVGVSLRA